MELRVVCEYNEDGFLFYCQDFPGAYVRGREKNEALAKLDGELRSYLRWSGTAQLHSQPAEIRIVQEKYSSLSIAQADSDVLFDGEREALCPADYEQQKLLALRSARDFRRLYESIPNPDISPREKRLCFYGPVPRTPREMYLHTNQVTSYYTAAFGLETENVPDIYSNRLQALSQLEELPDFLSGRIYRATDGEEWTLRKVLRRFLWHDRIHAKAMWRTASALWGSEIANPFFFLS